MTCVGDIAEQVRGVTYSKDEVKFAASPLHLPLLRANNIINGVLSFNDLVYVSQSCISNCQRLKKGDVVIATSSGSISVVGKAAPFNTEGFDGSFGAFCKVLRPKPKFVDSNYFSHFFQTKSYRQTMSRLAAGASINNLKNEHLDDLDFPLPSLDEQRRIAAILDKADALRRKRIRALELFDGLTQSIYYDVLKYDTNSQEKMKSLPLSSITSEIYRYPTYFGIEYQDLGVPEVRGELIQEDGTIRADIADLRFISKATSLRFPKTCLSAGDLVMSVRGTIGKIGLVPIDLDGANITANLIRIAPDRHQVMSVYLQNALKSAETERFLKGMTATTTIATIKASDLRNLPIMLPPMVLQEKFCALAERVDLQRAEALHHKNSTDNLFASLQHRAFTGQL